MCLFRLVVLPIARLSPRWRYRLSDAIAWVLRKVVKYRREVIDTNIAIAFPEKPQQERAAIRDGFYQHFTDTALEQTWLFAATQQELERHCILTNRELIDRYYTTGRPVIICAGHHGNYEMAAISLGTYLKAPAAAIYAKLRNPYFNERIKETRARFGLELWAKGDEAKAHLRDLAEHPEPYNLCFAFDQSPHAGSAKYWYPLFGRMAAHARGVEAYARKLDAVVVYGHVLPDSPRGSTIFKMELITETPRVLPEGEILKILLSRLETVIREDPTRWLWSHRRWKLEPQRHMTERDTVLARDAPTGQPSG